MSTIALVTTMPMSSRTPIMAASPRARSVTVSATITPTRARGSVRMMTNGFRRLPKAATMTRYTRMMPTAIAVNMAWKPSAMSAKIPPLLTATPGGRSSAAIFSSTRTPTACVSSETISAMMLADRRPSVRLMDTGPSRNTGSARSPRGGRPTRSDNHQRT